MEKGPELFHLQAPILKVVEENPSCGYRRISFSENGAKGNTFIESFNGGFKGENKDLFLNAGNIRELRRVINERMEYYNETRRHSALGYMSPLSYINHEMILPEPVVVLAQNGR